MELNKAATLISMCRAVGEQSRERHFIEPVKGGCIVRSCTFFFLLCEQYIPSAFQRRHAVRPAAGGSRRATSRFVSIFTRRISKWLLTKLLFSLLCNSAR